MGWQLLYLTLIPSNLYLKIPHPTLMRNKFLLLSCCYICFEVNPSSMSKHGGVMETCLHCFWCWSSLLHVSNINTFVSLKSLFIRQHLQLDALLSHFYRVHKLKIRKWPTFATYQNLVMSRWGIINTKKLPPCLNT